MKPVHIATSPLDLRATHVFIRLPGILPAPVNLKVEGYNSAGSIKLKPAIAMVEAAEAAGSLAPGGTIVESSSGNLGVALAVVCAAKGYRFVCVTDPVSSSTNRRLIQAYGGTVHVVRQRDANGGYLGTRIALIREMLAEDPTLTWLNQYANPANWGAHSATTGPEILDAFPTPDWIVIGAGTTGTLMGVARHLRQAGSFARIVAVDTEGSVTFGGPSGPRRIPGLGTSRVPEISDPSLVDRVIMVPETETVAMCLALAHRGFLFGGSTGTVLAGAARLVGVVQPRDTVIALAPDGGDRYLDTLYDPDWRGETFGPDLPDPLDAARRAEVAAPLEARRDGALLS